MKPLVYLATITTNGDYEGGSSETGLFNPVSKLLPTSEFTSVRWTFEVLSRSSADIELCAGLRVTNEGATWPAYLNLADLGLPGVGWTSATGWRYYPFIHPTSLSHRFFQAGFYARRTGSGTSRELAVVRLRLDFKNSLVPQQEV